MIFDRIRVKTDVCISKTLAFLPKTVYHIPTQISIAPKNTRISEESPSFCAFGKRKRDFGGKKNAVSFHPQRKAVC
jgi:hypothetical protein